MIADAHHDASVFGPWNPGIASRVPDALLPFCTIFRAENTRTPLATARELHDLTGLELPALVALRPERLALHELLVRVTADFSVPDGARIEDLGINFRQIVRDLLTRYVAPEMPAIAASYEANRVALGEQIARELSIDDGAPPAQGSPAKTRRWYDAFRRKPPLAPAAQVRSPDDTLLARLEREAHASADPLQRAACAALRRVVSALIIRHGELWGDRTLIAAVATDLACNAYAGDEIGRKLEPLLSRAAAETPYRLLPPQSRPVVMNTKGASASGKSTLRPRQRRLAADIGVDWAEFALISPDIWRKQLLDYASLGEHYKYGGTFTGDELAIIDQKLDRYMARKAERGDMPHLLIDRFRFDSFAPDSDEAGSNLLTRFGRLVYLFFMITPPESLVERAWKRGLDVGRYKAVDDTLAHGVEAYTGMPGLFFTWIARTDKRVHFEFLDNSVRLGEPPRTVAFGWNDGIDILDVKCLLDVERYRRVNVDARNPGELYADARMLSAAENTGFLRQCIERVPRVNFADQTTGRIYLQIVAGKVTWVDGAQLATAAHDNDVAAGIRAVAPQAFDRAPDADSAPRYLDALAAGERLHTLGAWGRPRAGAG